MSDSSAQRPHVGPHRIDVVEAFLPAADESFAAPTGGFGTRVRDVFGVGLPIEVLFTDTFTVATMAQAVHDRRSADLVLGLWPEWFDQAGQPLIPPATAQTRPAVALAGFLPHDPAETGPRAVALASTMDTTTAAARACAHLEDMVGQPHRAPSG